MVSGTRISSKAVSMSFSLNCWAMVMRVFLSSESRNSAAVKSWYFESSCWSLFRSEVRDGLSCKRERKVKSF